MSAVVILIIPDTCIVFTSLGVIVLDIAKLVKLLKPEKIIYIPKRPGEPDVTYADIKKIQKDLKWRPAISFEEGVGKILYNIEYWKNAPLWNEFNIAKETKLWFKYLK